MRKVLFIIALLCAQTWAAPALVQKKVNAPGTSGSTRAVTVTALGSAHLVAVFSMFTNTTSSTTPTATGLTFVQVGTDVQNVTGAVKVSLWYAKDSTGGAGDTSVSCNTAASASFLDCFVMEFSGVDTTAPLRTNQSGTGNSSAPATAALTVTVGDLVIASAAGNAITAATAPMTLGDTGDGNADSYLLSAGSTSITPTYTASAGQWAAISAAFIPSGGAAATDVGVSKWDKLQKYGIDE